MSPGNQPGDIEALLKARAQLDEELRKHKTQITIMFTDVVGSSAFFDRYGDTAGVAMLHRHDDMAAASVAQYQGRIIKTIGDAVMAEFPSPPHAARAAAEMQQRILRLNQQLPEHDRTQLRVGINYGNSIRRGNDVYGDAVNMAARICKKCGPAQILISRNVHEALANERDLRSAWVSRELLAGKSEEEDLFEVVWTEVADYRQLRLQMTQAVARGELHITDAPTPMATPAPTPAPTAPVEQIFAGRFRILEELGRGGMGIVYKAEDRETGEVVALKVLKPHIASDTTVMERFKNELRLARKITHRYVCRIYEFGRSENTAYITMELVSGVSMRRLLREAGKFDVPRSLEMLSQICEGLQEAHRQGIVHRDLKPENVMIDSEGQVRLMDFGISRSIRSTMTLAGVILGTPMYMSPEQAEGKKVDQRADIYALGLVLYEMVTGHTAFGGETPLIVAVKQVYETPPLPREYDPTLPLSVERIILRCMEKDAALRYQSLVELRDELRDALQDAIQSPGLPAPEATPAETEQTVLLERLEFPEPAAPFRPPAPQQTAKRQLSWLWLTPIAAALAIGGWILSRLDAKPAAPPADPPAAVVTTPVAIAPVENKPAEPSPPETATETPKVAEKPKKSPVKIASAVAASGRILIDSDPKDCVVIVDGKRTSHQTPAEFALPPGAHKIRLEHEGHDPLVHEVTIVAGKTTNVQLSLLKRGKRRFKIFGR